MALKGRRCVSWTGRGALRIEPQLMRVFFEESVAGIKCAIDELLGHENCTGTPYNAHLDWSHSVFQTDFELSFLQT